MVLKTLIAERKPSGAYCSAMDTFFDFLEFLAILYKRRWPLFLVILGPTILCLLLSWCFGLWWY